MMLKITFLVAALLAFTNAHSMMQCLNYDMATGNCLAAIRNSGQSKITQSYRFNNGAQACQTPFASPLSSYYSSGSSCASWAGCPDPMGTIAAGSTFNVMWFARNHAVASQGPGNVVMYLSPKVTDGVNADPSGNTFKQNQICQGSYMNCPNGNGDTAQCYLQCTLPPTTEAGTYTVWWYWNWSGNDGNIYTTCSDITVTSANGGSGSASTSSGGSSGTSTSTSGSATGASSTSGTATGSSSSTSGGTSGSSGTTSGDFALIARAPYTIPHSGSFNVTVAYKALGGRDLIVDLLDTVDYGFYGKGVTTVAQGKGGATVTVNIANNPPNSSEYILNLWVVEAGKSSATNAWLSAFDTQEVQVTVSGSLAYRDAC